MVLHFGTLHPGAMLIILSNFMPKLEKKCLLNNWTLCDVDSNAKQERDRFKVLLELYNYFTRIINYENYRSVEL